MFFMDCDKKRKLLFSYRGDSAVVQGRVLKQNSIFDKHSHSTQNEGREEVQVYVGASA